MTKKADIIRKLYNFSPSEDTVKKLGEWEKLFIEYNSHTNLMSKNDIPFLFEKHVLDSLSICLFDEFKNAKSLLDVGCGGGFPSVIISLFFPEVKVFAVDSRGKKITFLNKLKEELSLDNLNPICARIEDIPSLNVDIITNRAVGKIADVWKLSSFHLKKGGYFVSYKALTSVEEVNNFLLETRINIKPHVLSYELPLNESNTRNLVIFKK